MYSLLRKILFQLPPERAHDMALRGLKIIETLQLARFFFSKPFSQPREVMGLSFPNPVGLAAGLDHDGDYLDALSTLGFGFIEIGGVTPKPQTGNTAPRLFRLPSYHALINRLGFPSKGAVYVSERLKKVKYKGLLGINISKNRTTPNEKALDDYLTCFNLLAPYASYMTINISSPNTPGLRDLQTSEYLKALLPALKEAQHITAAKYKYVPLVLKIAPDLTKAALEKIAHCLIQNEIDGVIATNTTITRENIHSPQAKEVGGLSGEPLAPRSTAAIATLHAILKDKIPIIASGGVMSKTHAKEKLDAGASLLQIYTGLIYQGPKLIKEISSI